MTKSEMIKSALIELSEDPIYSKFSQIDTINIQMKVGLKYGVNVSDRQIQRVRKKMSKYPITAFIKGKNMSIRKFDSLEIGIINTINNSFDISIQELQYKFNLEGEKIKDIIRKCKEHIKKSVWDDKSQKHFFDPYQNNYYFDASYFDVNDLPAGVTVTELASDDAPQVVDDAPQMDNDYWEVELDCVTACSKVKNSVPIIVSSKAKKKVGLFMKWSGRREWLAYLVGKVHGDYEKVEVFDIYLPDQNASTAFVGNVVAQKYNHFSIVGVIHSHHEMGSGNSDSPSFSGHDSDFINSNHNVSLLVGFDKDKKININGIVRLKTPCGAFIQVKANVKSMKEESPEEKELKKEFEEKVKRY